MLALVLVDMIKLAICKLQLQLCQCPQRVHIQRTINSRHTHTHMTCITPLTQARG